MDHQSACEVESSNENNGESVVKPEIQSIDPAAKRSVSSSQGTSCTNEDKTVNVQETDAPHLPDSGNHGDNNGETSTDQPVDKDEDDVTGGINAPEETAPPTVDNTTEDQGDTSNIKPNDKSTDIKGTSTKTGKGIDPAAKRSVSSSQGTSCTNEDKTVNVQETDAPHLPDSGNHGDNNGGTSTDQPVDKDEDDVTGGINAPEETAPSTVDNTTEDQGDTSNFKPNDKSTDIKGTSTKTGKDDGRRQENAAADVAREQKLARGTQQNVETIGPTNKEKTKHPVPEAAGSYGGKRILLSILIPVLAAVLVWYLLNQPESPPPKKLKQIDIFLRQMEKVKSQFPNQRSELWKRSRIHLERHLNTTQPTEPVSLILTAGLRAKRTLRCLAQGLASTFSSALNASILHIDGASKASQDSDEVKLDIDSQLQGAFEGDKPVAVIHRFEELPPGSTLIFYRYCDHENAAYKKTFLIFTVLLEEEEEIPTKINLSAVEEMVDDHLQKKFLSDGHPVAFDRMDLDKYGGLWSRISHLILPVAAEKRIEYEGC
ncbi:torsin-1A-interacting protein 2-like isoform X1 [Scomber scombrus]|uniref:torsin-1A-interacting protein 2-like isoform X1 n=1 Tax=Scomber scombrus TaxID=13677 RepID=UPI002DDA7823|nr:torsin-1A-interacting protein 2-like isoform X1 [Scomber scombrus]